MSPPSLGSPWPETLVGARRWGRKGPVTAGISGRRQSAAPAVRGRANRWRSPSIRFVCFGLSVLPGASPPWHRRPAVDAEGSGSWTKYQGTGVGPTTAAGILSLTWVVLDVEELRVCLLAKAAGTLSEPALAISREPEYCAHGYQEYFGLLNGLLLLPASGQVHSRLSSQVFAHVCSSPCSSGDEQIPVSCSH